MAQNRNWAADFACSRVISELQAAPDTLAREGRFPSGWRGLHAGPPDQSMARGLLIIAGRRNEQLAQTTVPTSVIPTLPSPFAPVSAEGPVRSARGGAAPCGVQGFAMAVLATVLAASCASYPDKTADAMVAFESGRLAGAQALFAAQETTDSPFLRGAEAGTVALARGQWKTAVEELGAAAAVVEEAEDAALVSPEAAGKALLQWTVNESWQAYLGEGYERVYLHGGLALAYLALGQLEDVLVEVKRGNALLEAEEELYESSYGAGGLGHFLSAVAYELMGEREEAFIDYRRLEAKNQGQPLVGRALVRLARETQQRDLEASLAERYGADFERPRDAASIVVIAGVGLGPRKAADTMDVVTEGGLLRWSVPRLVGRPQPVSHLELAVDGAPGIRTSVIEQVTRVARANLQDRLGWLATRSVVRSFLKLHLTETLEDKYRGWGRVLGDLISLTTERADLRAWQTLPDTWQACRLFIAPGAHALSLAADGGRSADLGTRELNAGETVFVLARSIGRRLYAYTIGGRPVALSPPIHPQDTQEIPQP
ncbi:MAG: hypothetical protein CMK00_04745 [Planctomycetes bacterium]|nr:hypothetical protein [Planctomycetota bacterium]